MSTIDLIVLGFLLDRRMNAYELVSFITEKQIGRFLKISTAAVYKRCKRLYEEGFLNGEMVKEGEQPEKTVYSINKKGEKKFFDLMEHFSSSFAPFFLDCNAFIWNIEKLEKEQGLKMLTNLHDELLNFNVWIIQHEKAEFKSMSFASRSIVKQYRLMISTLYIWSKELIADYKKLK